MTPRMRSRALVVVAAAALAAAAGAPAAAAPAPAEQGGLTVIAVKHSLLGTHTWYQQTLRGIPVLQVNLPGLSGRPGPIKLRQLANAMKPIVLPGESLTVKLLKRGEEPGQGVGYLDDGTMVVAEQGAYHLGETVRLTVTSVLQTSAGRMIFGKYIENAAAGAGNGAADGASRSVERMDRNDPGRRPQSAARA